MRRDIVVLDRERNSVLYREGPYDGRTVSVPFWNVVRQIKRLGLDEFKAMRDREAVDSGPRTELRATHGAEMGAETVVEYYFWRILRPFRRRDRP